MCVIQQQVPLPLPCVNFAQIIISSLTRRGFDDLTIFQGYSNARLNKNLLSFLKSLMLYCGPVDVCRPFKVLNVMIKLTK